MTDNIKNLHYIPHALCSTASSHVSKIQACLDSHVIHIFCNYLNTSPQLLATLETSCAALNVSCKCTPQDKEHSKNFHMEQLAVFPFIRSSKQVGWVLLLSCLPSIYIIHNSGGAACRENCGIKRGEIGLLQSISILAV